MDAGKALVALLLAAVAASIALVAATGPEAGGGAGGAVETVPAATTTATPPEAEGEAVTATSTGTVETGEGAIVEEAGGKWSFSVAGKVPYVKTVEVYAVNESALSVVLYVELPTPCHNVSASAEDGAIVVYVESPDPKVMCAQVVKMAVISVEVGGWQGGDLVLRVVRDGSPAGEVRLPLTPP